MKALTYDVHPKHILEANGLFAWERIDNEICRCSHKQSSHLEGQSICLDKSRVDVTGIYICDAFSLPGQTISTSTDVPKKKIPSMKEQEQLVVKDGKVAQNDSQEKFTRQYGII